MKSADAARTSDAQVKRVVDEELNAVVPAPPVIPPPSGEYAIDLATALRLADTANPTLNRRTVILEALADQLAARTLLLPSLNAGGNYHGHNGALQRPTGKIKLLSEQSLYLGAGAGAVGSGTIAIPGVNILTPLTDAWFRPLAAQQRVAATRFIAQAMENDILMDVAVLHLELIRHYTMLERIGSPNLRPSRSSRQSANTPSPARVGRPTTIGPRPNGDIGAPTS